MISAAIENYIHIASWLALIVVALWAALRLDRLIGSGLVLSFSSTFAWYLLFLYSDLISFSGEQLIAPIWIKAIQAVSILSTPLVPIGLWLLLKRHAVAPNKSFKADA